MKLSTPLVAALLLLAAPAAADMRQTIDVSMHTSHAAIDHPARNQQLVFTTGLAGRLGVTDRHLRYGIGVNAMAASIFGGEVYLGVTTSGYRIRPIFELRSRLEHHRDASAWQPGVGFRMAVQIPISEYFFVDLGAGRDFVGPELYRASVGFGLPIQFSHL